MTNYKYKEVKLTDEMGNFDQAFLFTLQKPLYCPICGVVQDGKLVDRHKIQMSETSTFLTIGYKCTNCDSKYIAQFAIDTHDQSCIFTGFYPHNAARFQSDLIEAMSPKFIDMYNQASDCEDAGNIELAAVGYRSALEFLIKDYAITELLKPKDEVVKKHLYAAIESYLGGDSIKAADVVRILGNDFTHYERKYPQHDFDILKVYMQVFIKEIEAKLLISHPPVSR